MYNFLVHTTTFIIGSEKNAGKTTFLNDALAALRQQGIAPAFLTIGVDGEQRDQVYGHPKPRIHSERGDFLVTTESMLKSSDGLFEIHEVFPGRTVLGRLVLANTRRGGYVELIGPEENTQLSEIVSFLRSEKQAATILVDGAVNRLTQVSAGQQAGFVYVVKVTPRNLNSALEKMRILSLIKNFHQFPSWEGNSAASPQKKLESEFHKFKGALTKNKLKQIPKSCKTVILEDFTKIFLSYSELSALCKRKEIVFETIYQFHGFVVNLYDVSRKEFRKHVEQYGIIDVIFNPYQI